MKRLARTVAVGQRVHAAGTEYPDNHPLVKTAPTLFGDVAEPPAPSKAEEPSQEQEKPPAEDKGGEIPSAPKEKEEGKPPAAKPAAKKPATKKDASGADGDA